MSSNTILPATLLCDFYKVSHKNLYPKGTTYIYSNLTPRSNKYLEGVEEVVVFGIQGFIKQYLVDYFNENFFNRTLEDVANEYKRVIKYCLGVNEPDVSHIKDLHDIGYLPIRINAIDEGVAVPLKTPVLTIENTDSRFFWLTNYLETLLSTQLWQPMTSASKSRQMYKLLNKYADETASDDKGFLAFQSHDFSMRGMSSLESAMLSGAGHLLSFSGTDTIPAIHYLEKYYNANIENELVGASVVATEHSIMSSLTPANSDRNEYEAYKYLLTEACPEGIMSVVSDTYDLWKVVTETLPRLKGEIMNRNGKLVIRPDSGNPVDILTGNLSIPAFDNHDVATDYFNHETWVEAESQSGEDMTGDEEYTYIYKMGDSHFLTKYSVEYNRYDKRFYYVDGVKHVDTVDYELKPEDIGLIELLWNIFSGTINSDGYKVLDPHIGAIYGDSINLENAEEILKRLKEKGFASSNVVFGVGSFTYQFNSRDSLGFAMKATHAKINGEEVMLKKDPATDSGLKRSLTGKIVVIKDDNGNIKVIDGLNRDEQFKYKQDGIDLLKSKFYNGVILNETSLQKIKSIMTV